MNSGKNFGCLACFPSCSGHLQPHYMLTYSKSHCATHVWFTGTEPTTQLAGRSFARGCLPPPLTFKTSTLRRVSARTGDFTWRFPVKWTYLWWDHSTRSEGSVAQQFEIQLKGQETWWYVLTWLCFGMLLLRVNGLSKLQSTKWAREHVCFCFASSEIA